MNCPTCGQEVAEKERIPDGSSPAEFYAKKDKIFAERKTAGEWPADICGTCKRYASGCCVHWSHHLGDCCLHCGNDEREKILNNNTTELVIG